MWKKLVSLCLLLVLALGTLTACGEAEVPQPNINAPGDDEGDDGGNVGGEEDGEDGDDD